jgi:hypothetical protein
LLHARGVPWADSLAPLGTLLPLAWLLLWGGLWLRASGPLFQSRPRLCFALYFALFVEAVVTLIFDHLTHSIYSAWRTLSLPLPLGWALVAVVGVGPAMQVTLTHTLALFENVCVRCYLGFALLYGSGSALFFYSNSLCFFFFSLRRRCCWVTCGSR